MTIDSPILGLFALAVALACCLLARRLPAVACWPLRFGAVLACGAVAGLGLRCDRPLEIAVMVDVSPSTRGAAFRDERSVRTRLTSLLADRPFTLHYFADGEQPTAAEPACERTRLTVPDHADAVLLMSDGRFEPPAILPPTFALLDPALDRPADAVVRDVSWQDRSLNISTISPGDRELNFIAAGEANVIPFARPSAGPAVVFIPDAARAEQAMTIRFTPGDAWPENDAMRITPSPSGVRRLAIGLPLPGFEQRAASDCAINANYSDVAVIVMPIGVDISAPGGAVPPQAMAAITRAVREAGSTLVLIGPPQGLSSTLRPLSPLQPVPPAGPQAWTILIDASGSMAADVGDGTTRWSAAVAAGREAIARLSPEANVSVLAFAGDVRVLAAGLSPADALRAIAGDAGVKPNGPTGLRAALDSLATRAAWPTRVLVLSDGDADLGDVDSLATTLRNASVRLDAVGAGSSVSLGRLCLATDGMSSSVSSPAGWAIAVGAVTSKALPVTAVERWPGRAALAGGEVRTVGRWPAYLAAGAELLAGEQSTPVAAVRNFGLGRVVTVAGDVFGTEPDAAGRFNGTMAALADAAIRLERPPADPRFRAVFDDRVGTVRLSAADDRGPMNDLTPVLRRAGAVADFTMIGPGEYAATLSRRPEPTLAQVVVGDRTVARAALPGRYATEFDMIGNDRDALAALARRTGGAVIEAGDNRPLPLPRYTRCCPCGHGSFRSPPC